MGESTSVAVLRRQLEEETTTGGANEDSNAEKPENEVERTRQRS